MLYCPKCQKTYEEGGQRFCLNEGERLIPFASGKLANQSSGVFTSILKRKNSEVRRDFSPLLKFAPVESKEFASHDLQPSPVTDGGDGAFETIADSDLELEVPTIENQPSAADSALHLFESDEDLIELFDAAEKNDVVAEKTAAAEKNVAEKDDAAEILDLELDLETETPAVSVSEIAVGQLVNNRYRLIEPLDADESSATFLAADQTEDRQALVKILKFKDNAAAERIFAEENDALIKLNHPNIVNITDSGELSGGESFIVTEYVAGETVKDELEKTGQFDALRAARIVRQTAEVLDEAHRSGVLHRNLHPANIILTVDENGAERVRLKNFGAASDKLNGENLVYKSPEQIEGKIAVNASDNYALGVLAYQMLTNRLPFNHASVGDLLKSQREGVRLRPSDVRFDLPPAIDDILKKALSFHSFERYLKIRDFGEEFFSEIIANLPFEAEDAAAISAVETPFLPQLEESENSGEIEMLRLPIKETEETTPETIAPIIAVAPLEALPVREKAAPEAVKATDDLAWEKRSSETPDASAPKRALLMILGAAVVVLAFVGIWYYFINRSNQNAVAPISETAVQTVAPPAVPPAQANANAAVAPPEIESPPIARQVTQPPNSSYFQNSKAALKGEAVKNYLGFSLYYPTDWALNEVGNNFLDVSKKAPNGLPIEQMLVSYYNSKGTYSADAATVFPAQIAETNETLKKILPNYRMISKGKKTVNNGWQAYEIEFEGESKSGGETVKIWGKRLFIPTAIRGVKNGYVITMLATSLSKDVKSLAEVGVKGELSTVLETFEPNQNF